MFDGLKVLLVEDDPTVREGSEQALQLELEAMMTTRDELTKWPKPAVRT